MSSTRYFEVTLEDTNAYRAPLYCLLMLISKDVETNPPISPDTVEHFWNKKRKMRRVPGGILELAFEDITADMWLIYIVYCCILKMKKQAANFI